MWMGLSLWSSGQRRLFVRATALGSNPSGVYLHRHETLAPENIRLGHARRKPNQNTNTIQPKREWVLRAATNRNYYLLRPETIESLFVLYRVTHKEKYREMGWKIYQLIEK